MVATRLYKNCCSVGAARSKPRPPITRLSLLSQLFCQRLAMDPLLWLALAAVLAVIILAIPFIQKRFSRSKDEKGQPAAAAADVGNRGRGAVVVGGMRRPRNVRARIAAVQRARAPATIPEEEEEEEEDADYNVGEYEEALPEMKLPGKIGTKKLRKIQEKAERKAMREQEETAREDRKRREALREEERKREAEEYKLEQEREEEERRKQKEEQERREHEEYLQLKEAFVVEEEGERAEEEEEGARGLQDFINYIKKTKVVFLEDLAAEFNLKTQDAISRVQDLQESGELTGVVDDRGKFIYISPEELQAVAKFIRQRGRVSIAELVSSSNTLINLQPDSPSVH